MWELVGQGGEKWGKEHMFYPKTAPQWSNVTHYVFRSV